MKWVLCRKDRSYDYTFGSISTEGCCLLTLEKPDLDNHPQTSCIPTGEYICKLVQSPKFGETYEVTNVPNRSHILIHSGNTVDDIKGCILLGTKQGVLNNKFAVLNSRVAFKKFMDKCDGIHEFTLVVENL